MIRSFLAGRLFDESCANPEFEELVGKSLCLKIGKHFVSKIHGMQIDISAGAYSAVTVISYISEIVCICI